MSLSTLSIKRPVLTIVMNLLLILFGIIGYTFLGVREFPSIDPAQINVRTTYAGANADIIESQITEPLEKALNAIDGIKNITSSSRQGSSNITIEFNLGKNLEEAANDVRDKVSQATRNLPQDIDAPPIVSKSDADSEPIITLTLESNDRNTLELSDYAENVVVQRLQSISGVSAVNIWGQKKYAMRLWINAHKLTAYGLTILDIRNALQAQNVELPSGKLTGTLTEIGIKTIGNLTTEEEFNNIIISSENNKVIRLRDVGNAYLEAENFETNMQESGKPMVSLVIIPQPGTNYLEIANNFYKEFDKLQKELPDGYSMKVAIDTTLFIKKAITEVLETLLISIVLVVVIIYLFFRNWGIAFRPLIDIPVSLIATFFIMYLCGFSINVLTLLAIVLATGLVVDDGIVVTENIYKKVEEGMSPFEAAIKGSNEIFYAVISISITLAAVFLPVIFLEGFVGSLFREFGIVIGSAVLISAFVSLTLTPMLNAYMMKGGEQKKTRFYLATEPFFEAMNKDYANVLKKYLNFKYLSFLIVGLCFGVIYFFLDILPKETAPYEDRNYIVLRVTGPEGISYDYMDKFMNELDSVVSEEVYEKNVSLVITSPGFGASVSNNGLIRIGLVDPNKRERTQQDIINHLSSLTKKFSEGKISVSQQPTISVNKRGGLPVQYIIQANNFEDLREKIPEFMDEVAKNKTFSVNDINLKFNSPEVYVSINREKAEALGVSVIDIAQTLQMSLSGQRFDYFMMNGKQYQVMGQFEKEDRATPMDLKAMYVKNNKGQLIQLDNILTLEEHSSPPQLYRNNRYVSATVSAGLAPGKTIGDGLTAMNDIRKTVLDDRFTIDLGGESRDFVESGSNTMFAFGLAVLLIFLILAAQFESFIDPIIILITVPMAVAGAVFSLWLFGQSWNIFSQIGTIMLIGLVTKNGILIVEFANHLREQGYNKLQAIIDASEARLRPILMTSLAIALGALPIALSLGAASTSRIGMGVVIVGGTLFSLVLTLFVIPAFYLMMSRERKKYPEFDKIDK